MAVVKLPSGRTVKVPDGMSRNQTIEYIFDKLDGVKGYEEDRKKLGDQLDTSGWGAAIGSTIGGIAGGVAGIFTSPSVVANPITLGAAGSAGGGALGEGIEQWITGKGDWDDIAWSGAEGGAWGLIPGVGGQAAKTIARHGGKAATQIAGSAATGAAGGAGLGGGAAAVSGGDVTSGAVAGAAAGALGGAGRGALKGVADDVIRNVGDEAAGILKTTQKELFGDSTGNFSKDVAKAAKKFALGYVKSKVGRPTGVFQMAEAKLDLRRAATAALKDAYKAQYGKGPSRGALKKIKEAAQKAADDAFDYGKGVGKYSDDINPPIKPRGTMQKHKGQDVLVDEAGNMFDPKTGQSIPEFAMGGLITGYANGGEVTEAEGWAAESAKYAEANKDVANISASDLLDFVPVIGDIKSATEVLAEINKPNPNWALVGALAGATIIGVIPGIGDAAAAAIKQGAKRGLKKRVNNAKGLLADKAEVERQMIPNLAERSIAAGQPNIFEGSVVRPEMVKRAQADSGWNFRGEADDVFQRRQGLLDMDAKRNQGMTDKEIARRDAGLDEGAHLFKDYNEMFDQFKKDPKRANQGPEQFKQWLEENGVDVDPVEFEKWMLRKSHKEFGGTGSGGLLTP